MVSGRTCGRSPRSLGAARPRQPPSDTNGEQVLRQLASPATAAIPVIILSGDSGRVTVKELLAAGAADFLAKPFDIHQLLEIVERYLP